MRAVVAGVVLIAALAAPRRSGGKKPTRCPAGHGLYLVRYAETFRACFVNAGDCDLIAGFAQKAEPLVRWYCR